MNEEWYEYDEDGDVLDVYFGERRAAWTIELTPNIMISIDRATQQAVSLIYMALTQIVHNALPTSGQCLARG